MGLEEKQIPFKKERTFIGLQGMGGASKDFEIKTISVDFDKIWAKVVFGNERIKRVKCEILG